MLTGSNEKLNEKLFDVCDFYFWIKLSSSVVLSEKFIRKFKDKINWYRITEHQTLSENFMRDFVYKIDWSQAFVSQNLSRDFLLEIDEMLHGDFLIRHTPLYLEGTVRDVD